MNDSTCAWQFANLIAACSCRIPSSFSKATRSVDSSVRTCVAVFTQYWWIFASSLRKRSSAANSLSPFINLASSTRHFRQLGLRLLLAGFGKSIVLRPGRVNNRRLAFRENADACTGSDNNPFALFLCIAKSAIFFFCPSAIKHLKHWKT